VVFCFILGLARALRRPDSSAFPTPGPSTRAAPVADLDQTMVLFVGVDDLSSPSPRLRAVWWAAFRPPGKEVFLYGIPLNRPLEEDPDRTMSDVFRWSPVTGVDPMLLMAMRNVISLSPALVIVLDEVGFATLIDFLGGVTQDGETMDGATVIGFLNLIADKPQTLLETQATILGGLRHKIPTFVEQVDLTPLTNLIPAHAYLSESVPEAFALLSPLLPIDPESIHVMPIQ